MAQARYPAQLILTRGCFAVADDRGVLVDIYGALRGDDWKRKDHWVTSREIGKWYGVTVENGKVVKLGGVSREKLTDNEKNKMVN